MDIRQVMTQKWTGPLLSSLPPARRLAKKNVIVVGKKTKNHDTHVEEETSAYVFYFEY